MAPSTPPPPSSARLAAFTIASTSSVVMSATITSSVAAPTSAMRSVMRAIVSRVFGLWLGLEIDGAAHADVVKMRVEEFARGAPAVVAQHFEEIVVGVEPARGVERLRRAGERDPVHVDAPVLPGLGAARQLALV